MRLIDADDLLERFVYADVKTELVNAAHDIIEAAPTIRCADCVHFRLVVRFAHGFITTCQECDWWGEFAGEDDE